MTLSMYDAAVPACLRALSNLDHILVRAEQHAAEHEIDPAVLVNARLFPDMFALVRQVQIASDIANRGVARLASMDPVSMPDQETTFGELRHRLRQTIELLEAVPRAAIDGSEKQSIRFPLRGHEMEFEGQHYLFQFVLPNVYFHVTTAYNILRHNGVVLGKPDFLGDF